MRDEKNPTQKICFDNEVESFLRYVYRRLISYVSGVRTRVFSQPSVRPLCIVC